MTKQESLSACEGFRSSVMLSINSMQIDGELKANLLIRFQGFYLSMLQELVSTPTAPISDP